MSIETKYICDVCGAVRGETNHWFVGAVTGGVQPALFIEGFRVCDNTNVKHLCGQKCAHALLDRWLTTGSLEA